MQSEQKTNRQMCNVIVREGVQLTNILKRVKWWQEDRKPV